MKWLIYVLALLCLILNLRASSVVADTSRNTVQRYNRLFYAAFEKGENFKAREYAAKALIMAIRNSLKQDVAIEYSNLAIVNVRLGNYEKANQYNFNSLKYFGEMNDTLQIARCNLNIGTVYIKLKEYTKALSYIEDARDSFYQINDQLGYSISLSNIGSIYLALEDYKTALPIFFEAVELDEKNNDPSGTSSNFLNIGVIYLNLENYYASREYLQKALAIDKAMGDMSGIAVAYLNSSKLLLATGKPDSALLLCRQSIEKYRETGQLSDEADAIALLAEIYDQVGNFRAAYKYHVRASALSDSLMDIEKAARIAMLEEKYINEKLKSEILSWEYKNGLQESEINNQRKMNAIWLIGLILSIVTMAIIIVQLRNKNTAYKFIVRKNIDLMQKEKELSLTRDELEQLKGTLVNISQQATEPSAEDKTRSGLPEEEKLKLLARLRNVLIQDKLYTKPDLTVDKLAKKLATNRTYLSQIINDEFNKSYSDLINEYRLKEAMTLLSDPIMGNRYSIEAIAHESGFNNISNFNMLFRKHVGTTPSVFRKNAQTQ